jgi:hypothetical protein
VEILHSAFRHDVQADDMQHVLNNALVIEEVADDPIDRGIFSNWW